jgi:hypothetical protein
MAGSTPIYGFPYPQSTDLVADYPALGQELATDVETVISGLGSGLNIVSATSIANTGGTATRTNGKVEFSGVSSLSLNGIFTSTYDNYRIIISGTNSASNDIRARLRLSGTDNSGATAYSYGGTYVSTTTTGFEAGSSGTSSALIGRWYTGSRWGSWMDIVSPALAVATNMTTDNAMATLQYRMFGYHDQATAYDGITIFPAAGTITGIIRVYGYKNS